MSSVIGSMDSLRTILANQGPAQIMQSLKENGCTMPDQKIAEMLQFIVSYIDIQLDGHNMAYLPKKELCQLMEYLAPSPPSSDVKARPGKGFTAVMRSLLRCMGATDAMISTFSGNKRTYKYIMWTQAGHQKFQEALRWHADHPLGSFDEEDDDFDDDKRIMGQNQANKASSSSSSTSSLPISVSQSPSSALSRLQKSVRGVSRAPRGSFAPKYDVLFSRSLWSYFIRVFMPMCEPTSLQSGIKLDLLRGQLSLRGRYSVMATLPPWCTQNETLTDFELVQQLPPSASGDFALDISLPFDVDRTARKEVHVTDIGLVVALKRVKEDGPHNHLEFKIHSFDAGIHTLISSPSV